MINQRVGSGIPPGLCTSCTPPCLVVNHIRYVRNSGNHIHIKLTVQSFLHNFHVKQSQEAAAESKAQC